MDGVIFDNSNLNENHFINLVQEFARINKLQNCDLKIPTQISKIIRQAQNTSIIRNEKFKEIN